MCGGAKKDDKPTEEAPPATTEEAPPPPPSEAPPPEEPPMQETKQSMASKMSETKLAANQQSLQLGTVRKSGAGAGLAQVPPAVQQSILAGGKGAQSIALTSTRGGPKANVSKIMGKKAPGGRSMLMGGKSPKESVIMVGGKR